MGRRRDGLTRRSEGQFVWYDIWAAVVVLGVVWSVITLLGHGTWVLLAYLFRARRPPPREDSGFTASRDALRDLEEQLARCARGHVIDVDTYVAMHAALE